MDPMMRFYLVYMGSSFFTEMAFFILTLSLLDYPLPWKKMIVSSILLDVTAGSVVFLLAFYSNGDWGITFWADLFGLTVNTAAILLLYERELCRGIAASCIGYFCYYQIYTGSLVISGQFAFASILAAGVCVVLCFGLGKLFRKLRVSDCLEYFSKKRSTKIFLLAAALLLSESYYGYMLLSNWLSGIMEMMPYQTWLLTALFLMLLLYLTFYTRHRQREELQEMVLLQQQMYIGSLEELQKEVRMYRHDYKNVISGMMLKAKEGDTDGVLEFLKDTAENFDDSVGRQIQQTTQIANLCQAELKSLVLSKMAKMQELGIRCQLEVMHPVEEIAMNPLDLNRCVGILVDNAIEAVSGQRDGSVTLIFSRQEECLTILVGNTIRQEVDVRKIFQEGYSSKGNDRGLGLASLERILKKYRNVASMTRVCGREFVQELKIS